jgi:hypothetical protein
MNKVVDLNQMLNYLETEIVRLGKLSADYDANEEARLKDLKQVYLNKENAAYQEKNLLTFKSVLDNMIQASETKGRLNQLLELKTNLTKFKRAT